MVFTITMLSWSTIKYSDKLRAKKELVNALNDIKWCMDYLIKVQLEADVLYGEVGDCDSDHECWQRPEDLTTPRTVFRIDDQYLGSDLAAKTAAAFTAVSIVIPQVPYWVCSGKIMSI
ncbi:Glycoside hydrolase [Parasponia andersonii]|uniref:cellulase n=1 Tax=Parasponia andersonii TaxID=3476 RepID=A0A2P5DWT9_PARAD|nr:Glycoside hydrolase [Parasponia andersonii]